VRRTSAVLAAAGLVVAACGSLVPAASAWPVLTLPLPGGQILNVTIEDRTGLVEGVSFVVPDPDYPKDEERGIAVKNVANDPSHVLVSWVGGACSPTKAHVIVERSGPGLSITVNEPQPCTEDQGRLKTMELAFRSAIPAGSVQGTWLPR